MGRILLADDDRAVLDLVRRALQTDGHAVVSAEDGSEAAALLRSKAKFDLLVTDVQMPGLDGLELVTLARNLRPDLGLLMMSGYLAVLENARKLGLSRARFLSKPFTIESVRLEVRSLLA